jgi:multidrug resistance efflux pump
MSDIATQKAAAPEQPPPRPSRTTLRVFAVIVLILAVWWGSGYFFAYTDDAFVTSDIVAVAPEVTGPIVEVHVHDNQLMKRGQPLIMIDPTPFELELRQAQAAMAQTAAQLPVDRAQLTSALADQKSAEADRALADINQARAKDLVSRGAGTVQNLDNLSTQEKLALNRLEAASATVQRVQQTMTLHQSAIATANAAVALAQWRLDRTKIVAPTDGPVSNLTVRVGDMATAYQPIVGIVDGHAWRVEANYKEWYLRHFKPGMTAWVWLDTMPWTFHRAHIEGMSHAISRSEDARGLTPYVAPTVNWIRLDRRIPVRIELDEPPPNMRLFQGSDARTIVFY